MLNLFKAISLEMFYQEWIAGLHMFFKGPLPTRANWLETYELVIIQRARVYAEKRQS